MRCQNSQNIFCLASSLISLQSWLDDFWQAINVHLGPTALGCFVTIWPPFWLLLTYALSSILSRFCLFCFHFKGSASLVFGVFLPASALSRLVVPFFALGNAEKNNTKKVWINYLKRCFKRDRLSSLNVKLA